MEIELLYSIGKFNALDCVVEAAVNASWNIYLGRSCQLQSKAKKEDLSSDISILYDDFDSCSDKRI